MDLIWWIAVTLVWTALALWPARVAARKGHNPFLFFIFGLFVLPVALLVAYLVPDHRARLA